ncbi:phospho-N-acetylmuramoyl-pentapeptide-transferase [bacterium]|nr:phospho-N-acetylmuramoyl-pentapeptide-transferase [bacterium]
MILYLVDWLRDYFPSVQIFNYITIRIFISILTSFFISIFFYPKFINFLRRKKVEQTIREDGPKAHLAKAGTPTMGGVIIIFSLLINVLLFTDFMNNFYIYSITFLVVGTGIIGFYDDYLNITKSGKGRGLSARSKFLAQILIATVFMVFLYLRQDYAPELHIPIFKGATVDIGWWYIPFGVLVIVGTSNAVNLTDGMDGLATVPSMVSVLLLAMIVYLVGHAAFANYLHLFFIGGAGELAVVAGATFGSAMAFLWYNTYPAQIFMGDTGSLTLGALLGGLVVVTKTEFLSIIFNGIFVIETLSVIIQVTSFKLTGKRVFRMAPFHHHFEVTGKTAEPKLVVRFWIVAILLAIVSTALIKVR